MCLRVGPSSRERRRERKRSERGRAKNRKQRLPGRMESQKGERV